MHVEGCHARYSRLQELRRACAPRSETWLSEPEQRELSLLKSERRRCSWLAGRWLAKHLIRDIAIGDVAAGEISILSRNEAGKAVRPDVTIGGSTLDRSLSISHTDRGVLVVLADSGDLSVGADLTAAASPTRGFLTTWFTERERQSLSELPAGETAVFWAIKEAVYKACQRGESFTPRKIEVFRCQRPDYQCRYGERDQPARSIAVGRIDGQIAVVVVADRLAEEK